jgi:hypothetical protein
MRITATVQDFLRLGIAKVSHDLSDSVVGRLRAANVPVKTSRTVRLPGGVNVVEVSTGLDGNEAYKIARTLSNQGVSDVVTIYDGQGRGYTGRAEGLGQKGAALVGVTSESTPGTPGVSRPGRKAAQESGKYTGLIEAVRNIWEKNGDDMAQLIDFDTSEYESPDIKELVRSVLPQYLSDDQREQWDELEEETQTNIMNHALGTDAIVDVKETLDNHFANQTRGASREKPKTLQACADPLDLGLKDPENLVRVNQRGSINDLFS